MTTLAVNKPRPEELGHQNDFPVIAADIIYEGAAVGLVPGTGHARPLAAGDLFAGFATAQCDNSLGGAAAKLVHVLSSGRAQLAVTGAVITDVGQLVFASDDDTFSFVAGGAFIGVVHRFVSAGVVIVAFDAITASDQYADRTVREVKSANYTLDAEDSGKLIVVDTDGVVLTLPAIADGVGGFKIMNGGAFGTVGFSISPDANDMILGPNITGANNKDLINTKATAKRGDFVVLDLGDLDGYVVTEMRGIWAREG